MTRYIVQRLLAGIFVMFGVVLVVFIILRLTGDPVALLVAPNATQEDYDRLQEALGLDKPLVVQFAIFLSGVARADFGRSFVFRISASEVVLERFPATVELATATLVMIVFVAIPLGIISATRPNSVFDHAVSAITLVGQAIPSFWLGIMFILLLAVQFGLLPTSGRGGLTHLIMPVITLAARPLSRLSRLTRSEMLEVLTQDYVRTARAKGLSERRVLIGHALKNVALSLLTLIGLDVGYLLGGAIITETVFAWPGIGRLLIDAISQRDFPVVQANVVFMAAIIVV